MHERRLTTVHQHRNRFSLVMTTALLTLAAIGVVFALAGRLVGLALAVVLGTFTVLVGGFLTI